MEVAQGEGQAQKANLACTEHPSGVQTPSAKDPGLVDQEAYQKEGATWDYRWEADCSQKCNSSADCTKNTASDPAVKPDTSAWCFEFTDGNRCMILTTTDKSLGEDKNKSGGKYGSYGAKPETGTSQGGTQTGSQPGNLTGPDNSAVCKESADKQGETQKAFFDAKVANNLVRFNAILKGVPDLCVPSDLGATDNNPETATKGDQRGRLLLCSGAAKAGGLPDLVWRIVVGNQLMKPDKEPPSRDTLEAGFKPQLDAAKAKVGL